MLVGNVMTGVVKCWIIEFWLFISQTIPMFIYMKRLGRRNMFITFSMCISHLCKLETKGLCLKAKKLRVSYLSRDVYILQVRKEVQELKYVFKLTL